MDVGDDLSARRIFDDFGETLIGPFLAGVDVPAGVRGIRGFGRVRGGSVW